jgi:Transposase DDE domain
MASSLTTSIRQRLYTFARRLAKPFTDSRRRRFLTDMVTGLVISGHVHLTKVARALGHGLGNIHADEKRLSKHLGSEHWDASPIADELLRRSAALAAPKALVVADTTDVAKYYARHLEGLGRVHDGSDPEGRTAPGYALFEAYVRVGRWQLFPLRVELLKTYAGVPTGENAEIERHVLACHEALGRQGTWVLDRGFGRRNLYAPLVRHGVAFVARQVGDRHVRAADGRAVSVSALAGELRPPHWPRPWPRYGHAAAVPVHLPEVSDQEFLLVVGWRYPDSGRPLLLLVSPQARGRGRTARWFVKAYLRRWGVEDATRGVKQQFDLESFLVRSWRAIQRLVWLVAWAFWWLNLWGEAGYTRLREALVNHPWRLRKRVVYLFDWIATMLRELLHPHPKLNGGPSNTG